MRKKITEILLAFAILAVLSAAFWKAGWLTTAREVGALFAIAAAVIAADLAGRLSRKRYGAAGSSSLRGGYPVSAKLPLDKHRILTIIALTEQPAVWRALPAF